MSVEVMVFSKCFISGGNGLLLHNVENPHGVTSSDMLPGSNEPLLASCPHPGPIMVPSWSPRPGAASMVDQAHPLGIPMLLHGASSLELLTIIIIGSMGWK